MSLAMLLQSSVAQTADSIWGAFSTPIVVIILVLAVGAFLRSLAKRYLKVPPEKALIIYGGGKTRVVSGGAKFVWPMVEDFYFLELGLFQFEVDLKGVPNKDSVPISVKAAVSAKISNKDEMLPLAAGMFGKKTLKEITEQVKGVVDGHVRALIGQSDMETILRDQDKFKQSIQSMVATEMSKIGCEIVALNIQEVSDPNDVIASLGKPEIARVKAEASIKEAEQTRRQTIQTTNATREAASVKADNDAQVALAERDLNTRKAQYQAEVAREQAKAAQAGPLAEAEARKGVVVAQVAVLESETTAKIGLQARVRELTEAELNATVITAADAEKRKVVIVAEGVKQASIVTAEGARQQKTIEAEGAAVARKTQAEAERQALEMEGLGQAAKTRAQGDAQAEVTKKTGEAAAAAKKAELLAEAEGQTAQANALKAKLLAEAAGQSAKAEAVKMELLARAAGTEAELKAQATGMQSLMEAYHGLTPEQMRMVQTKWILEALPGAIAALGEAGEKVMTQVAGPIAAALGSIDNITIYDSAHGDGDGAGGSLERYAKVAPQALMQAFLALKETGMLPVVAGALAKAGIDLSTLAPGLAVSSTPTSVKAAGGATAAGGASE